LLYKYFEGRVCSPEDLRRPEIYRGVARRIAEWHATLRISAVAQEPEVEVNGTKRPRRPSIDDRSERLTPDKPVPNVWTVMQKWIYALPTDTEATKKRQAKLQSELEWMLKELGNTPGIANYPLVFSHCDLLSGNVIVLPSSDLSSQSSNTSSPALSATSADAPFTPVGFIDYEYATPSPAAFDIANHFAEWGGFDCDFSKMPTRSQRRDFLLTYLTTFDALLGREFKQEELEQLFDEVDVFRGAPGFYWGIWALIQATISQIDFDYANYAEVRLGEYWAWKDARAGHVSSADEAPLRERRWHAEE
jgi:ethanolamine kinase